MGEGEVSPFNVGDVVQLKTGGPKMTVEAVDGNGVKCAWFSLAASFHADSAAAATRERWDGPFRDTFAAAALVAV